MNFDDILHGAAEPAQNIWAATWANPLQAFIIVLTVYFGWHFFVWFYRYIYMVIRSRTLIFLKITLPREDSQKDKEKADEKDFREKISIMEQLYRNLYELGELSLRNMIYTFFFKADIVSFELVAQEKVVEFFCCSSALLSTARRKTDHFILYECRHHGRKAL